MNNKKQYLMEYVFIFVLLIVIVVSGVKLFGGKVNSMFQNSSETISTESNMK